MTQCFYIFIFVCIVTLQSTIMAYVPFLNQCYDLLLPFIIYLGIFRNIPGTLLIIVFFGFVMDSITGGPFGLYLTTYLWLFFGMRWIITFLHVRQSLLVLFVVAFGVAMENFIFIGSLVFLSPGFQIHTSTMDIVIQQVLLAVITGPFLLIVFENAHKGVDKWLAKLRAEGSG